MTPVQLAPPLVTMLAAGTLILLQMVLMLLVVIARRRARVSLGAGADEGLLRAIRRHGNLAENAPIFLLAFALLEMIGTERARLATLAIIFVVARLTHIVGLSLKRSANPVRVAGVAGTAYVGFALGWRLVSVAAHRLFS
jgi:uncharacterized membrane protein YecN with MAPEG domain